MPRLVQRTDILVLFSQVLPVVPNASRAPAAPAADAEFVISAVHEEAGLAARGSCDTASVLIDETPESFMLEANLRAYGLPVRVEHPVVVVCLRKPRGQITVLAADIQIDPDPGLLKKIQRVGKPGKVARGLGFHVPH